MTRCESLQQWLQDFTPLDAEEAAFHKRMNALLQHGEKSMSRSHFQPGHFTSSAFVLSPRQDALLLIFHGKLHRWLQPGGHIDPDDRDILSSAQREIEEEIGLTGLELAYPGIFDVDIHSIPALRQEPAHEHFDVRFLSQAKTLDFTVGSDASDARWWPLAEISEVESDRSVMRAVEKWTQHLAPKSKQ